MTEPSPTVELRFRSGTLEIVGPAPEFAGLPAVWDERSHCLRAPASAYVEVVQALRRLKIAYVDQARQYDTLAAGAVVRREPRPYQNEALAAWMAAGGRGVVVLPTGAGKTLVAHMAIDQRRRSTLVVTPTLDLVRQWYDGLVATFGIPVGIIGGGEYDLQALTVTTYDSAYLHMEHLGNRFGFLVFDECHHLPGASYSLSARLSLAPFRMGLTATPERDTWSTRGQESEPVGAGDALTELIGPIIYRKDIVSLSGDYLSSYETVRVTVELSPAERAEYAAERALYRAFLESHGISMASPRGWTDFIIRASRNAEGRRAFEAYRRQRAIAFTAPAKLDYVERLLHQHRRDRAIIFTQDNATVHLVARRFLLPAITHQTRVSERSEILDGLAKGRYTAIATSKVLNEGVDVPEANVAIVMSGSGSVREHVQRLGRILRKKDGKQAILYELVAGGTSEAFTSQRRREHIAYR
ncbi:MAG TPA: DEAD/DEAH box helicase family protein [Polyangia bacterium]